MEYEGKRARLAKEKTHPKNPPQKKTLEKKGFIVFFCFFPPKITISSSFPLAFASNKWIFCKFQRNISEFLI